MKDHVVYCDHHLLLEGGATSCVDMKLGPWLDWPPSIGPWMALGCVKLWSIVCLEEWRRWKEEIQTYCWRNTLLVVLHRNYDCVWFHVCFQDGDDCRPKWKGDPEEIATHLIVLCNATFRLKCPAEGKPKPIIRWLKNGLDFTRREKGNVCMLYAWMQNLIKHLHAVLDLLLRSVCISCLFLSCHHPCSSSSSSTIMYSKARVCGTKLAVSIYDIWLNLANFVQVSLSHLKE